MPGMANCFVRQRREASEPRGKILPRHPGSSRIRADVDGSSGELTRENDCKAA